MALGKNLGQAELKAEHMGKQATATLTVGAAKLVALSISPKHPMVAVAKTVQFTVQGINSDGTAQDLSGLASYSATDIAPDSGVASISSSGLATGTSRGRATIAASYLGLRAEVTLSVELPAGACSTSGWCWQNPLPLGKNVSAIWGSAADSVWVVGGLGMIHKWNGVVWSPQASGTKKLLVGVWGSDANNVWAIA